MNPTSLLSGLGAAISAEPKLGGAGSSGESSPGTGDLFLALVTGLLGEQPADRATGAAPQPGQAPSLPDGPAADAAGQPVADPGVVQPGEGEQSEPQPDVLDPSQVAASVVPTVLPPALLAQAVPAATRPADPMGTPVADAPSATTTGSTPAPATTTGPPPATSTEQRGAAADTGSHDLAQPDAAAASAPTDEALAPSAAASSLTAQPAAPSASFPSTPQAAPVAPVAGIAAPATVAGPAAPTRSDVHRVAEQVFPEVVRVSGSADGGPQRVTVKLNPEALGEVRVTLTQRGGELEVTLSAGHEARRALAEGTPELQRLLESVGRADSRVVIRDLPTGSTPVQPIAQDGSSLRTDVSTDLGGDAWSGAGRPGGEPAPDREATRYGTPGSITATDGTPSATTPSRATTTDQSRRSGGLDVSI